MVFLLLLLATVAAWLRRLANGDYDYVVLQAATDRWAVAAATYQEAIDLARESGQQAELVSQANDVTGSIQSAEAQLSALLAFSHGHGHGGNIVPPEYLETVFNKKNATTKNTFTVDGFVAGAWRIDKGKLSVEPFAPLPAKVRREVDSEGARLLAWYVG